jgi:uncharacterized protein YndB with AHSA1/START domain
MSDPLKLQVKRLIKASSAELFDAWTNPELMQKWYAPGPMTVTTASSDLRVGGAYRVEMREGQETIYVAAGTYKQIIPNQLVSFTWNPCTSGPGYETLVTVEFKQASGGTEVILTHGGFADAETVNKHEQGWNGCLDNLAKATETVSVG